MPEIGEIRKAKEIGRKRYAKYIWAACPSCGKERWEIFRKPHNRLCRSCNARAARSSQWKGGRVKTKDGYILIKLQPDDFFYSMAEPNGYVREHRLVVARALGRCLLPHEIIHHKNGNKDDNRYPENLEILNASNHLLYDRFCRNCELKKEIRLLRLQVKNLQETLQEKMFIQKEVNY